MVRYFFSSVDLISSHRSLTIRSIMKVHGISPQLFPLIGWIPSGLDWPQSFLLFCYIYLAFLHFFSSASLIQVCVCGWTKPFFSDKGVKWTIFDRMCKICIPYKKEKKIKKQRKGLGTDYFRIYFRTNRSLVHWCVRRQVWLNTLLVIAIWKEPCLCFCLECCEKRFMEEWIIKLYSKNNCGLMPHEIFLKI